jgi:starch phosphorylase
MKNVEKLESINIEKMNLLENRENGNYRYSASLLCGVAGRFGLTARVIPSGDDHLKYSPGLITWA